MPGRTPHPRKQYNYHNPKYSLKDQLHILGYGLDPQQSRALTLSSTILDSRKKDLTFYAITTVTIFRVEKA